MGEKKKGLLRKIFSSGRSYSVPVNTKSKKAPLGLPRTKK